MFRQALRHARARSVASDQSCTSALVAAVKPQRARLLMGLITMLGLPVAPAQAQLPTGWSQSNIGNPGLNGSVTVSGATFHMSAAGDGANWNTDQGYFVYKQVSGDQEIVIRATKRSGQPALAGGAQIGLMMRKDMVANGTKGAGVFSPDGANTQFWCYTTTAGGPSFRDLGSSNNTPLTLPLWLKLVRKGNEFGIYKSLDGEEWSQVHNYSGGAFPVTGTYSIGIWLSSNTWDTAAHVSVDNIYVGAPRLKYQTSFVGSSLYKTSGGWMQNNLHSLYVDSAGRSYTNSSYDETDNEGWMFDTNGNAVKNIHHAGGVWDGSVTGDGTYVYLASYTNKISRTPPGSVYPFDLTEFTIPSDLGTISGMACKDGELYVSDRTNNRIVVFSTTTLAEIPGRRFNFTQSRPGPIAVDASGNLWIVQQGTDFPAAGNFDYKYPAGLYCYTKNGAFTGRAVSTGITSPTGTCIDSTNRLLVCDNGPDQNIKIITNLDTAPAITSTFGQTGGIYSGSTPGLLSDGNAGGDRRFYGLTGVGTDSSGNIYVASSGAGADLRKFNAAGVLQWRRAGLEFIDCADFDPDSDGTQIYTKDERMLLNYPATIPDNGVIWADQAITQHRFLHERDERKGNSVVFRRIAGQKFLITGRQGNPYEARFFRFNGEIAIPCARVGNADGLAMEIWTDADGDGVEDAGEIVSEGRGALIFSYDIDSNGDLWMAEQSLRRFRFQGLNSIGAPQYSFSNPANLNVPNSALGANSEICGVRYHANTDTLFGYFVLTGYSDYVIRRFNNFAAGGRTPAYNITLPKPSTDTTMLYHQGEFGYKGFDVATDKIFISEIYGRVHVYDANTGARVMRLVPGPEIGGIAGWQDMGMGLRAFKRSNGEYAVLMENSGNRAALILYRFFDPTGAPPTVAWWKMDNTSGTTATDSSGAGKHGTVVNGTWDASGKLAGCVSLSGSTAQVAIPDNLIKNHTVISVTAWFKSTSTSGGALLGYQSQAHPAVPTQFVPLLYVGTDGKLRGQFWQGSVAPITSTPSVNDGAWHHVALVGNSNTQTLYLDGVAVGTLSGTINHLSMLKNQLGVGYAASGWPGMNTGWRFLGGKLDDVRIYNRALTASQVMALARG